MLQNKGWQVSALMANYWKAHKPEYTSFAAMICPLHNSISKEQCEKHLCNPSSHNGKYRRFIHKVHAPYLDE